MVKIFRARRDFQGHLMLNFPFQRSHWFLQQGASWFFGLPVTELVKKKNAHRHCPPYFCLKSILLTFILFVLFIQSGVWVSIWLFRPVLLSLGVLKKLLQCTFLGSIPRYSDSVGLRFCQRICISNKLPDAAAGLWMTFAQLIQTIQDSFSLPLGTALGFSLGD